MSVATQPHAALRWDGRRLAILDQTLLPGAEEWIALEGAADTAEAIRRLAVRGAPLIGVAAAYGLAMEVTREPGLGSLERGWELLRAARPTAVNLAHAVDRVRAAALAAGPTTMAAAARVEAERIHAEEDAASERDRGARRRPARRRAADRHPLQHRRAGRRRPRLGAGGYPRAARARRDRGVGRRDAAAAAGRAADRVGAARAPACRTRWWSTAPWPG